ncbi:USP22 protein [Platysternon megacephalum]|uniref:USP22 protein n=1 Tax=Platysternon megacephalum TaxID=55544 RepID=A0A4D9DM64_9SAUR|nr:USP22 protein [Platysternon megacephalum]
MVEFASNGICWLFEHFISLGLVSLALCFVAVVVILMARRSLRVLCLSNLTSVISPVRSRFVIRGESDCTFLSEDTVSSSRCYVERNWICSKPDAYAKGTDTRGDSRV